LIDGYVDELGYIHRRPGTLLKVDLGTNRPIDGLFWWTERGILVAVSDGNVYVIDEAGTATNIGTGPSSGGVVSFVNCVPGGTHKLVMANGGQMYLTDGATVSAISGTGAPTNVRTVAFLDQYIIASNSNTPSFQWSGVNDPETWSALSFATAEVKPDDVIGIATNWDELYVLGTESIEVWYNDGSSPFIRRDGATINRGTLSPNTFQRVGNTFMYLDSFRHVIELNGRSPVIVSNDIDKTLADLTDVSNASAMVLDIEGRAFYVITFRATNKTFAYDYKLKRWSRWGQFDSQAAEYNRFVGNCHAYSVAWNQNIIGSKDYGKIYVLSDNYQTDNGEYARLRVQTAHIDHGTSQGKRAGRITFRGKRGNTGGSGKLALRYRDNGTGPWSNEIQLDMGGVGDYSLYTTTFLGGIYHSRQYEIVGTDNVPLLFGEAEEEVEVLLN